MRMLSEKAFSFGGYMVEIRIRIFYRSWLKLTLAMKHLNMEHELPLFWLYLALPQQGVRVLRQNLDNHKYIAFGVIRVNNIKSRSSRGSSSCHLFPPLGQCVRIQPAWWHMDRLAVERVSLD